MASLFDRKYTVPLIIVVLVLIVAAIGYKYYTTTSIYTLSQINRAIKAHDTKLFDKYMDMDKITTVVSDKMMDDIDANSVVDFRSQMKVALYKGFIRDAHDALATYLLGFFDSDVVMATKTMDYKVKKITNQGDYIRVVTLENPSNGKTAEIKLEKKPEGYWKVISLDLNELVEIGILSASPDMISVIEQSKKDTTK